MRARIGLLAVAFATGGCAKLQYPVPTSAPLMLGPVDRIGGKPDPIPDDAPSEAEFDGETSIGLQLCMIGFYPTVNAWLPEAGGSAAEHVEHAYAGYAGQAPLQQFVPRARGIKVGAYQSTFLCYRTNRWWSVDGALQKK